MARPEGRRRQRSHHVGGDFPPKPPPKPFATRCEVKSGLRRRSSAPNLGQPEASPRASRRDSARRPRLEPLGEWGVGMRHGALLGT